MKQELSHRFRTIRECVQPAPPEKVFPLLCPVREYEWIERWNCDVLYSNSGIAEEGCVFTTNFNGRESWMITHYEPPSRVEFCIFAEVGYVERLKITVAAEGDGSSRLRWERVYTALNQSGEEAIRRLIEPIVPNRMVEIDEELSHFLEHGEMLRRGPQAGD